MSLPVLQHTLDVPSSDFARCGWPSAVTGRFKDRSTTAGANQGHGCNYTGTLDGRMECRGSDLRVAYQAFAAHDRGPLELSRSRLVRLLALPQRSWSCFLAFGILRQQQTLGGARPLVTTSRPRMMFPRYLKPGVLRNQRGLCHARRLCGASTGAPRYTRLMWFPSCAGPSACRPRYCALRAGSENFFFIVEVNAKSSSCALFDWSPAFSCVRSESFTRRQHGTRRCGIDEVSRPRSGKVHVVFGRR